MIPSFGLTDMSNSDNPWFWKCLVSALIFNKTIDESEDCVLGFLLKLSYTWTYHQRIDLFNALFRE